MQRNLWHGIRLIILILTNTLVGCNSSSLVDKVLSIQETPTVKSVNSSSPYKALEQAVHQQINQYRTQRKLPPLTFDARISEQARLHSQAMASGKVPFSHDGFKQRVQAIGRVISYRAAAENVAFNQGYDNPGQQAVEGWIDSKGHRVNIEGQYNLTGIGVAKNAKGEYYLTQIFILSR